MSVLKTKEELSARLEEVRAEYDKNFERLLAANGGDDEAITTEDRLDKESVSLMKKLGIFIHDPCPLIRPKSCLDCTGSFRAYEKKKQTVWYRMVPKDTPNSEECSIKINQREV